MQGGKVMYINHVYWPNTTEARRLCPTMFRRLNHIPVSSGSVADWYIVPLGENKIH